MFVCESVCVCVCTSISFYSDEVCLSLAHIICMYVYYIPYILLGMQGSLILAQFLTHHEQEHTIHSTISSVCVCVCVYLKYLVQIFALHQHHLQCFCIQIVLFSYFYLAYASQISNLKRIICRKFIKQEEEYEICKCCVQNCTEIKWELKKTTFKLKSCSIFEKLLEASIYYYEIAFLFVD